MNFSRYLKSVLRLEIIFFQYDGRISVTPLTADGLRATSEVPPEESNCSLPLAEVGLMCSRHDRSADCDSELFTTSDIFQGMTVQFVRCYDWMAFLRNVDGDTLLRVKCNLPVIFPLHKST